MSKSKKQLIGICHVCGKEGPLSYEHIPPYSLGNNHASERYGVSDIVSKTKRFDVSDLSDFHYKELQQRGSGFQTICSDCNSYFGRNYVREYVGCTRELGHMLIENRPKEEESGIHLEGHNVNLLAFFKHVISNFCTTTPAGTMSGCKEFLLNRESNAFPSHYKLFAFAVPSPSSNLLTTGWTTLFFKSSPITACTVAVVATFPIGFYLVDTAESSCILDNPGCDITSLSKCTWGDQPGFTVELPYMSLDKAWPTPIKSDVQ